MTLQEAMEARHAVRSFTEKAIDLTTREALEQGLQECSKESGLNMQAFYDEPEAFGGGKVHYGSFSNCRNYIAIAAKPRQDEAIGYYGEKIVLLAQTLGLNSCWVALTYSKSKVSLKLNPGERLQIVIAIGYGETQGVAHKNKPLESFYKAEGETPDWFKAGMKAALLAPTAMNQQKFFFTLKDNTVAAKAGLGFYAKMDLGIVKYHFELGAGIDSFRWA